MRMVTVAVVAACVLAGGLVHAELAPAQKTAADALIKQFSAPEFDARQKAVDALVAMGPDVVPLVKKALADSLDNEVKLRCQMVLKALGADAPAATARKAEGGKFGTDASRVTIHLKNADLDAVLQELADQSGNARIEPPKDWEGTPVSLDVTDAPYFEALNKLCAAAKLAYAANDQDRGLRLVAARDASAPLTSAGPTAVRIDSVTLVKQFAPPAGGPMNFMAMEAPAMTLVASYFYEDRLRPIDAEARVTKVVIDGGKEVNLGDPAGGMGGMVAVAMRAAMGQTPGCSGAFAAVAGEIPAGAARLKSVEGVVRMIFGAGEHEVKIAEAEAGKSAVDGKDAVAITQFQMRQGWGFVSVKHTVDGKDSPLKQLAAPYGIVLVDPKGNRHAPAAGGMFGGFNLMRAQAAPPPPQAGADVWIQVIGGGPGRVIAGGPGMFAGPGTGATMAHFQGLPDIEGQWSVIYVMPETVSEREFPFKLTDVPLP